MKNKFKKNEKGFALPLALLLLVVMTIMGTTLVTISSMNIMEMMIKIVINKHFMQQKVEFQWLKVGWL